MILKNFNSNVVPASYQIILNYGNSPKISFFLFYLKSFLAFYLIDGRLTIHLGTDSEERVKRPVISSTQTYSDGLLHSVFLSRMGKEFCFLFCKIKQI